MNHRSSPEIIRRHLVLFGTHERPWWAHSIIRQGVSHKELIFVSYLAEQRFEVYLSARRQGSVRPYFYFLFPSSTFFFCSSWISVAHEIKSFSTAYMRRIHVGKTAGLCDFAHTEKRSWSSGLKEAGESFREIHNKTKTENQARLKVRTFSISSSNLKRALSSTK